MSSKLDRKRLPLDEAIARICDGRTVAVGGFCGAGHPEALTAAIERRFCEQGKPRDLTLVYAAGQGDGGSRGLNHFGHAGLVKRIIGGHWRLTPKLGELACAGLVEAYNFPQGVICHLFRDIAAGRPGCITHVGLGTFVDPIDRGGRLNDVAQCDLVERVRLGDRDWLWYKAFPIDVALIRGTNADVNGSISFEREAVRGEALALAQAARNSGGIVIAQVQQIHARPADLHSVVVPGILVDHVVVAPPEQHDQTFSEHFNGAYCCASPVNGQRTEPLPVDAIDARRIIATRACDELRDGAIVNLGVGIPEGIAQVAEERHELQRYTLTVESGLIGGRPAGGLSFGAALYPEAVIDQPAQFDFYDGGGLDFAAIGVAQISPCGDVNVSKFNNVIAGVGGFINITQNAGQLVFCGTFTAGGLEVAVEGGQLRIVREGRHPKFLRRIEQVTFNAAHALDRGQPVLYITERAVFRLCREGLELIEVAPGLDLHEHVLAQMQFEPIIRDVRPMPSHVFETPRD